MTTDEEFFPVPERELRDAGVDAMLEPIREKLDELMKDVTPSAILSRAADLIRDTPEPWVSPAVAPAIEAILRQAALAYEMDGDSQQDENALALARAVLG